MKQVTSRFIAILLLVIPGIAACMGFLRVKNALYDFFVSFGYEDAAPSFAWGSFLLGLLLFFAGTGFIAGWVFFRDRKRNYVAPRFRTKRNRPPKPVRSSVQAVSSAPETNHTHTEKIITNKQSE